MSIITDLVQSVVEIIHEAFPDIPICRGFVPTVKLEKIKEKRILVVPREKINEHTSRSTTKTNTIIDVTYMYKYMRGDETEIDPIMNEVEEIEKLLDGVVVGEGFCIQIQNSPIYHAVHFRKWRQFTSLLTMTIVTARNFR